MAQPHRILAPVPVIEIGDDADTPRIRRPHTKQHAVSAAMSDGLRAEIFVELAFPLQGLKRARIEHAAEGIRIADCTSPMPRFKAQPIRWPTVRGEACNEESVNMMPFHCRDDRALRR